MHTNHKLPVDAFGTEADNAFAEVIQPGLTVVMNAFVTIISGGTPVFCDIDRDTWNITADNIRPLITSKTKAIMPVHYASSSKGMDEVYVLAKEYGLRVVEDAAPAFGCERSEKTIGSNGDIVCFSFYSKSGLAEQFQLFL